MPSEDFTSYAKSSVDFYALLSVTPESSQKELDRAWRKTALKYHPDKVGAKDASAKEKFHLAQIGYDLLSDPTSKQIYDNARNARIQRQRQNEQYEGRRRQMKEELEKRERGEKRTWEEANKEAAEDDAEGRWLRELQRIAKDGERRRKEREEALRKDLQKSQEDGEDLQDSRGDQNGVKQEKGVAELDRTVQVRWAVKEGMSEPTQAEIEDLFARFGEIESAIFFAEAKPMRLQGSKKKQIGRQCALVYKSIVGAHTAVEDFAQQSGPDWERLDSVRWAAGKEPDIISSGHPLPSNGAKEEASSSKGSPAPSVAPRRFDGTTTSTNGHSENGTAPSKPAFGSFAASAKTAPKVSPFGKALGQGGPSLEEMTMIRLRKLEQKRLAAEIEQREREAEEAVQS